MPGSAILRRSASMRSNAAVRWSSSIAATYLRATTAFIHSTNWAISYPTLPEMVTKSLQSRFGVTKETALPRWCKECEVLAACQGGCPKHRFTKTCYDEPGLHYLCAGYKKFFLHIRKYLRAMATLLENRLPASRVMEAIKGPLVIRREE